MVTICGYACVFLLVTGTIGLFVALPVWFFTDSATVRVWTRRWFVWSYVSVALSLLLALVLAALPHACS